jgi:hypothetical protein
MKKLIILIILLILPAFVIAGDLSYSDKRKLREAGYSRSDIRKIEREMEYKYEGTTGSKYKYDLSKPGDSIKYSVDPHAQIMDKIYMPTKPGVGIDRSLNQYGGGVKP